MILSLLAKAPCNKSPQSKLFRWLLIKFNKSILVGNYSANAIA